MDKERKREIINRIIETIPGLKQFDIAKRAEINPGQLSAWLKGKGYLSDEKEELVVAAIKPLVREYSEKSKRDFMNDLQREIAELTATVENDDYVLGDPITSITTPFYVRRDSDKKLVDVLKIVDDQLISIIGGAKTGKTSHMKEAINELNLIELKSINTLNKDNDIYLWIDFSEFNTKAADEHVNIFRWIASLTKGGAISKNSVLMDADDFTEWLLNNIELGIGKKCVFFMANLKALWWESGDDKLCYFKDLAKGLHNFHNEKVRKPKLKQFRLVFEIERSHKMFTDIDLYSNYSSESAIFLNYPFKIEMRNFSTGEIERLMDKLQLTGNNLINAIRNARDLYDGHPILTHAFGIDIKRRALENKEEFPLVTKALEMVLSGIERMKRKHNTVIKSMANLSDAEGAVDKINQDYININDEILNQSEMFILKETGLFKIEKDKFSFSTTWIKNQIMTALSSEQNNSES